MYRATYLLKNDATLRISANIHRSGYVTPSSLMFKQFKHVSIKSLVRYTSYFVVIVRWLILTSNLTSWGPIHKKIQ